MKRAIVLAAILAVGVAGNVAGQPPGRGHNVRMCNEQVTLTQNEVGVLMEIEDRRGFTVAAQVRDRGDSVYAGNRITLAFGGGIDTIYLASVNDLATAFCATLPTASEMNQRAWGAVQAQQFENFDLLHAIMNSAFR